MSHGCVHVFVRAVVVAGYAAVHTYVACDQVYVLPLHPSTPKEPAAVVRLSVAGYMRCCCSYVACDQVYILPLHPSALKETAVVRPYVASAKKRGSRRVRGVGCLAVPALPSWWPQCVVVAAPYRGPLQHHRAIYVVCALNTRGSTAWSRDESYREQLRGGSALLLLLLARAKLDKMVGNVCKQKGQACVWGVWCVGVCV